MLAVSDARSRRPRKKSGDQPGRPYSPATVGRKGLIVIVVSGKIAGCQPADVDRANIRTGSKFPLHSRHGEVIGRRDSQLFFCLHVEEPDVDRACLARQSAAANNRDLLAAVVDTDATTEEELGLAGAAYGKQAGVLEKERPFFREEQVEAIEIDLLLVNFHLRKVGVVGGIEGETGRQAVP